MHKLVTVRENVDLYPTGINRSKPYRCISDEHLSPDITRKDPYQNQDPVINTFGYLDCSQFQSSAARIHDDFLLGLGSTMGNAVALVPIHKPKRQELESDRRSGTDRRLKPLLESNLGCNRKAPTSNKITHTPSGYGNHES